jgi:hypothetical protein
VKLIELPNTTGGVFAVDPHAVSAVQPYRSTIAGRGTQVFDMCAVWLHNRSIFVCAWSPEQVIDILTEARQADADLFAAGYAAAAEGVYSLLTPPQDVAAAWKAYLEARMAEGEAS